MFRLEPKLSQTGHYEEDTVTVDHIDYSVLDRPEVLYRLFHPRQDYGDVSARNQCELLTIPTETGIEIGAAFHAGAPPCPTILFFHGNGETVADYGEMGLVYNRMGINFLPVDYRGYGRSTGTPTVTGMMRDSHYIFQYVRRWLSKKGFDGLLFVMGRSLGSASALEIAAAYPEAVDGLIIESGFADTMRLLGVLGINAESLGIRPEQAPNNLDTMKLIAGPTLVLHAEFDHIIPFDDGVALYNACPSATKELIKIPGADHNTIFHYGTVPYLEGIASLIGQATSIADE